ncbi:Hypothetical predicted protein [Cloeon dipterum]|uniref:WD repeat domain-containing protein 83 n=1 Tax=Cloeon dipterum TaxID=197152 RepID=A0A8S1CEZ7_9INSE|nr:Hypothetical predicted protein [Cloeon dipterum]
MAAEIVEALSSCIRTIDCKQGAVRAVRFNADGSYCLTCGSDRKIKLWNPNKNLLLKTYPGHGKEAMDVAGSCDSAKLVSCGADKMVIIWDVATGQSLRRYRGHATVVSCVRFNEDSSVVISGSHDNSVRIWDTRSNIYDPIQILNDAKDSITSIQVTENKILTGSVDGKIREYDLRAGQLTTDTLGEATTSVTYTRDGQCVLASCADASVRLIDTTAGELLNEFRGHTTKDYCVETATGPGDSTILCGSSDGCVWIWELVTGNVLGKLTHSSLPTVVPSLSINPSANQVLTASEGCIKLWGEMSPEDILICDD